MFSDDDYPLPSNIIRAGIELNCLRDNILTLKNNLLDQAGLMKMLETRNLKIKDLELENRKLREEFLKTQMEKSLLPLKIQELSESNKKIQLELESQQFLNKQIEFNNDSMTDRVEWEAEKKNMKASISAKDQQIIHLKEQLEKCIVDSAEQQNYYENQLKSLRTEMKSSSISFTSALKRKKSKIHRLKKHVISKHRSLKTHHKNLSNY
jgi:chromosome segregation ATPase